jgi:hypothetical protein
MPLAGAGRDHRQYLPTTHQPAMSCRSTTAGSSAGPIRRPRHSTPRRVISREGGRSLSPDKVSAPPDTMSGPSEPELNPNPEPESHNGTPLDAGRHVRHGGKQLGGIQVNYAGKPTLIARVLQVLNSDPLPWSRGGIADALEAHSGQVGRALGELRRRGYAERCSSTRYVLTSAGTKAGQVLQRAWHARSS